MASKRVKTVNFKMDDEMHNITFSAVRFSIVIKLMAQSLSLGLFSHDLKIFTVS